MASFRPGPFFLGAAIGVGVGGASVYMVMSRRALTVQPGSPSLDESHPALRYGAPTRTDAVRSFENFVADFDSRTRNPRWVLERINNDIANTNRGAERNSSQFFEDAELDPLFRSRLGDYVGSGYDRGHMVPAANHKSSQRVMDETFTMVNVSPQVGRGFNRDYWGRFEKFVRDLTKQCRDVYVVTGPLWMPNTTTMGPDGTPRLAVQYPVIGSPPAVVSVPTHFFKVILAEPVHDGDDSKSDKIAVGAFVMPNAPIDPATPLTAFSVPLERLEAVAGFRMFPSTVTTDHRATLDKAALEWQRVGHKILEAQRAAGKLLPGPDAMLALPGVSTNSAAAETTRRDGQGMDASKPLFTKSEEKSLWAPKTRGNGSFLHLCDMKKCTLPAEEFWTKGKKKKESV